MLLLCDRLRLGDVIGDYWKYTGGQTIFSLAQQSGLWPTDRKQDATADGDIGESSLQRRSHGVKVSLRSGLPFSFFYDMAQSLSLQRESVALLSRQHAR
ncbi:MAG: hypothetical protein D6704_00310 [Nitrospirae bacterium]|nr:MAG: hypothetical protein D6704_00310 [Nitrospirota bacterium]